MLQFQHRLSSVSFSTDGRWAGALLTMQGGQLRDRDLPEYRTMASSLGTAQKDFFDGGISRMAVAGHGDG